MSVGARLLAAMLLATLSPSRALAALPPEDVGSERGADLASSSSVAPDVDRLGWAVPDYARLQTGGFLGMMTIGIGYSAFRDVLNIGVSYGYVPPLGGAPHVHLGSGTVTLRPLRLRLGSADRFYYYPLYIGGGALIASSPNLFVQQPNVYPAGYYAPDALHVLLLLGTEVALRSNAGAALNRQSLFVEIVTIDQYLDALSQNRQVALYNAFSTAVGYRASF